MTDQDHINRFPDGEPVSPLNKPNRWPFWKQILEIFGVWTIVLASLGLLFYLLFTLVEVRRAHADEAAVQVFEQPGECTINADLRVNGNKRAACVDKLETAARLARAEMRVNERTRRK